jgi:hypothetical protein
LKVILFSTCLRLLEESILLFLCQRATTTDRVWQAVKPTSAFMCISLVSLGYRTAVLHVNQVATSLHVWYERARESASSARRLRGRG